MLRTVAEKVLGPIVVSRKLPNFVGAGIVVASPRVGGLRYLFRASAHLDPVLLTVASALVKPGDIVWDVGGNVGLFSAAASGLAGNKGSILAIEADKDAFDLLEKTARAQSSATHAKITTLNVAIADHCGTVTFCIAKRSRSSNFISGFGQTQTGGVAENRVVPALTLDALLASFTEPQVLKIDVEGAEVLVLNGAEKLLSTVRPLIFMEVASEVSCEIARILSRHDYRVYDGATFDEIPDAQAAPWDTIAIPAEVSFRPVNRSS